MNKITVNFMTAEITVSKAFYKRASIYDTPEYISLRKAMVENPSFKIVIAESNKRTYGKLTFERMEVEVFGIYIRHQEFGKCIFLAEALLGVIFHRRNGNHRKATTQNTRERYGKPCAGHIFLIITTGPAFDNNIGLDRSTKQDTVVFGFLKGHAHNMDIVKRYIARIGDETGM